MERPGARVPMALPNKLRRAMELLHKLAMVNNQVMVSNLDPGSNHRTANNQPMASNHNPTSMVRAHLRSREVRSSSTVLRLGKDQEVVLAVPLVL